MQSVHVPHKLPSVLSREEVARLIAAADNLKYKTALSIAYGAGLRASEVVALKESDIDSERMALRIEQGKKQQGSTSRQAVQRCTLAQPRMRMLGYCLLWAKPSRCYRNAPKCVA